MKDIRNINWRDVEKLCCNITNQISFGTCDSNGCPVMPDHIIGLARGGLIPATIIANRIGVRTVISHGYHSYDEDTCTRDYRNPHGVMYQDGTIDLRKGLTGPNILVVDDLCDEGVTMAGMIKRLEGKFHKGFVNIKSAALFCKHTSHFRPNYVGEHCDGTWLRFPWEGVSEFSD